MKNMHPSKLFFVKATSAKPNFPADNLMDGHPDKKWKGNNNVDTLTLSVGPGAGGILLGNTNAESVEITVNGADVLEWETGVDWGTAVEWEPYLSTTLDVLDLSVGNPGEMWVEYTPAPSAHEIHMTLTSPAGTTCYAGVAGCGVLNEFSDPEEEFNEGQKDYSIVKPLKNGGTYTKKKNVVRTYDGMVSLARNPDFYAFMDIFKDIGPEPIPWRLSTCIGDREWIAYARKKASPKGSHGNGNKTRTSISLIEVL